MNIRRCSPVRHSGIVVQVMLFVWVSLVLESYTITLCIEKYLRPLVQELVQAVGFWLYEPLQTLRRRSGRFATWWEFAVPVGMFWGLLAATLIRISSHRLVVWDYVGLPFNLGVFVVLSLYSLTAVKTRHAWEDAEPKGLKSFITDGA